jgi:hypothetical protein
MSYTLNIEPSIVKEAESCAMRNGTTVDAMIREYLLVLVSHEVSGKGGVPIVHGAMRPKAKSMKIGCMKDEINLPDNFDGVFDSLDQEVASMFCGTLA